MKLWKGRFSKQASSSSDAFNASIGFDQRLYEEDITGSIAHAKMLGRQGIITEEESEQIIHALEEIREDIEAGKVEFTIESEDIHMNIETILTERIGQTGKKLHTARSRNDQVALDIRMYLKKETDAIDQLLSDLLGTLQELAGEHQETVMPGYTHLQHAQPVTLAYHLLAYYQMFARDRERSTGCRWDRGLWPERRTIRTAVFWQRNWDLRKSCLTQWMPSRTGILHWNSSIAAASR